MLTPLTSPGSSHPGLLSVPLAHQAHSDLRAFALAVPSAENALPLDLHIKSQLKGHLLKAEGHLVSKKEAYSQVIQNPNTLFYFLLTIYYYFTESSFFFFFF